MLWMKKVRVLFFAHCYLIFRCHHLFKKYGRLNVMRNLIYDRNDLICENSLFKKKSFLPRYLYNLVNRFVSDEGTKCWNQLGKKIKKWKSCNRVIVIYPYNLYWSHVCLCVYISVFVLFISKLETQKRLLKCGKNISREQFVQPNLFTPCSQEIINRKTYGMITIFKAIFNIIIEMQSHIPKDLPY